MTTRAGHGDECNCLACTSEYANVVVTLSHIHVTIFSGDGSEVETYDIERRKSKDGVKAHFPKRMSLEEMRGWMERGCPLEKS